VVAAFRPVLALEDGLVDADRRFEAVEERLEAVFLGGWRFCLPAVRFWRLPLDEL
jgi:hypothetical protein